ncbi:MAG: glycosyltransferase family 4 protein [Hyphomicrobiales bacterium]|nr:glycosyltransferase family 4 protein [Hyphomicrobiales bacterium]
MRTDISPTRLGGEPPKYARLARRAPAAAKTSATSSAKPRALRILISSYRSHPHTGGQGIYLRLISRALAALGHRVDVISGPPYPQLDAPVRLIKLPSLNLYARQQPLAAFRPHFLVQPLLLREWLSHNSGGFPEPHTFGVRLERWLSRRAQDYDILHDNQSLCASLPGIARRGLPVVATIHHPITRDKAIDIAHAQGPGMKFLKWRWYHFLREQMRTARQLSQLVVISKSTQRDVARDFAVAPARLHLVYNGIDHDAFYPMPAEPRHPQRLITTASADVPLKGLIYLLRAYAQLLAHWPQLELEVIGRLRPGATADELRRLGLMRKVRFRHGLDAAEMRRAYARATLGVVPSVYEGFGFPAGEMLACGLPVVATNGGALPEVVGRAGVVVPHSDAPALAKAIDALMRRPAERARLARRARPHILKHFSWQRTARDLVRVYRRAIAQAR